MREPYSIRYYEGSPLWFGNPILDQSLLSGWETLVHYLSWLLPFPLLDSSFSTILPEIFKMDIRKYDLYGAVYFLLVQICKYSFEAQNVKSLLGQAS